MARSRTPLGIVHFSSQHLSIISKFFRATLVIYQRDIDQVKDDMLDGNSSLVSHQLQNVALIVLSFLFLPLDTLILLFSFSWCAVRSNEVRENRKQSRQRSGFTPRTILVTGVGMTKGLSLARLLHESGHDVVGADFEPDGSLVCGRVSKSLKKFYRLRKPSSKDVGSGEYIQSLLNIVAAENVELWVSCSGVASAVEDGMAKEIVEARTKCKAIQFGVKVTQTLHEKHSFIKHIEDLGLLVPATYKATSRDEIERILRDTPAGRKYIMKTIGVDDSVRGDMTLLPKDTEVETSKHIARLKVSDQSPWILQQFIKGNEYCTHSLIVAGRVKAFVACPSSELLMHYEALPSQSVLSQAMLDFTKEVAAIGGTTFTGHLSFDFMVENESAHDSKVIALYPIECNPRAHTAVALFDGTSQMVESYLSALDPFDGTTECHVVQPVRKDKYYWIGHELVTKVILPTLSLITLDSSISTVWQNYYTFADHLLTWKDGTYELWDPLPWWWLYHIYWPMRFMSCILQGKKWSRVNVSTTKMFEC